MPVPHYHEAFHETAYAASGKLRFTIDGTEYHAAAGDHVFIERGKVHAFANPFDEPAKVLCVITPGVLGAEFFREVRGLMAGGGPPDAKAIGAVMMKHGLVLVK